MDRQLRGRWTAALRSGQYQQGRQRLRTTDDKYCCLGVLADLVDPDGWERTRRDDVPWHGRDSTLPDPDSTYHGIAEYQDALIKLNDEGVSFAEIADWIEREVPAQ